ncbi:hypothetical protein JTB14_037101 [Gonioctena quinquepunctata]|nr:hypothetical protein JTB14_037101 [Gonioctena quinquepunctata]
MVFGIQRVQYKIEELDSQNTEEHDEIRKQFEDKHYALLVRADTLFKNDSPLATNNATDPNISNGQLSSIGSYPQFNIKLPQLPLPEFA